MSGAVIVGNAQRLTVRTEKSFGASGHRDVKSSLTCSDLVRPGQAQVNERPADFVDILGADGAAVARRALWRASASQANHGWHAGRRQCLPGDCPARFGGRPFQLALEEIELSRGRKGAGRWLSTSLFMSSAASVRLPSRIISRTAHDGSYPCLLERIFVSRRASLMNGSASLAASLFLVSASAMAVRPRRLAGARRHSLGAGEFEGFRVVLLERVTFGIGHALNASVLDFSASELR